VNHEMERFGRQRRHFATATEENNEIPQDGLFSGLDSNPGSQN
jgi:hypothetical protein